MRKILVALSLSLPLLLSSCSNGAEQIAELESKLTEQKTLLSDTIAYYTQSMSEMQFQMDSMRTELAKYTSSVTSGGSSGGKTTTTTPPKSNSGKIDVTQKGAGSEPQIDVTKKGAGSEPKIDVTKKGGGN